MVEESATAANTIMPIVIGKRKGLDYTDKATWSEANIVQIAADLGYVLNDEFIAVFDDFVTRVVAEAKLTGALLALAQNNLSRVSPPLERVRREETVLEKYARLSQLSAQVK